MQHATQTICILGLGYIGLPTASLLATKGYRVFGCDVNPKVVETINRGDIHIVEPDLDIMVRSAVGSGQLSASIEPCVADIYIIAVPTPFKENHKPDISYVESATRAMAKHIKAGALIILESTSPVGTTEKIEQWLQELRPDLNGANRIYIAHCPERVLPGHILQELVDNDRIIGGIDAPSAEKARDFYQTFAQGTLLITDAKTSEMSKLAENAFRDVNIAYANELSLICETLDINVRELIKLANHHPRVNILQPGPGVGGHCIGVDPWFIVDADPKNSHLIRTAREVNNSKPQFIIDKVIQHAQTFTNPVIACLGIAFKANIDDLRESPALQITLELVRKQLGTILVVEPHIDALPHSIQSLDPKVQLSEFTTALNQADILVLLVDHKQFMNVNPQLLKNKIIVDTRGIWDFTTETKKKHNVLEEMCV